MKAKKNWFFRKKQKEAYKELEEAYLQLLREHQSLQRKLTEFQMNEQDYRKGKEEVEEIHQHARRLKHDMQNHLMVILSYLNHGETLEARAYTSQILNRLNLDYSYIETGNSLLNFIVNQKLCEAQKREIYVKAEVETIRFKGMESMDISALLGNLLDNALEAAQQSKEKMVELTIRRVKGYEVIKVSNTVKDSVLHENPHLLTTKKDKDNHGIGMRQVKDIVEKYGGMLDIYEENGKFSVMVMLEEQGYDCSG